MGGPGSLDFGLELDNLISIETSKIFREEIGDNDDVIKQQAQSWSISSFVHGEIKDKQTRQVQKMKISKCL